MLRMGSSKPWPDALEALTGQREMSALPLLKYFRPLQEWLEKENARNGEFIEWEVPNWCKELKKGQQLNFSSLLILIGFFSCINTSKK